MMWVTFILDGDVVLSYFFNASVSLSFPVGVIYQFDEGTRVYTVAGQSRVYLHKKSHLAEF